MFSLDRLSLLLGPFFLIISFYEIICDLHLSKEMKLYLIIISDLCFFNLVHVGFSFSLLKTSPIFHSIYRYLKKTKPQSLTTMLGLGVIGSILFFLARSSFSKEISLFSGLLFSILIVSIFIAHHYIKQTFAMSSIINYKYKLPEKINYYEKRLCQWILPLTIGLQILTLKEIFPKNYGIFFNMATYILPGIYIILIGYLVSIYIKFLKNYKSTIYLLKIIFSIRFLIWPLIPFSFMAFIAIRSLHGVEYLVFCRKFTKNEESNTSILLFRFLCIIIILFFGVIRMETRNMIHITGFPLSILLIGSLIAILLGFSHVALDSSLFKMKDAYIRKKLTPFLRY